MISVSSEASLSYIEENATKQKTSSSKPNQIKKEGKADYFTVGGAGRLFRLPGNLKAPVFPVQEPKRAQMERSHPPSHPCRRFGSSLNLDTRIHADVSGGTVTQSHFHSVETKHHTAPSCPACLNSMDNKHI